MDKENQSITLRMSLGRRTHQYLRWTERFLKTDMVYVAKNGFWLTIGQGSSSLVSLLLAIAFAHFISKEAYGNYKYILSLGSMFGMFSLTGIGTSLVRSVAKGYDGTLRFDFWLNIRWSVLVFLGSLLSSIYYFSNDNYTLGASFLIIGSLSPFMTSASLHGAFLSGKKDFKRSSLYNIFQKNCSSFSPSDYDVYE
jgi:O-antigen/teichoic acid export membrane protein